MKRYALYIEEGKYISSFEKEIGHCVNNDRCH